MIDINKSIYKNDSKQMNKSDNASKAEAEINNSESLICPLIRIRENSYSINFDSRLYWYLFSRTTL